MNDSTPTVRASVSNYRGTPRKLRLLADFVRGKKAQRALAELSLVNKRHAQGVAQVIKSALANARHNEGLEGEDLVISEIQVQEGKKIRRQRPASRGRAMVFRRRLSHLRVTLRPPQT